MVGRFQYIFCPTNTACPISWIKQRQMYKDPTIHPREPVQTIQWVNKWIHPWCNSAWTHLWRFSITPNDESYDERLKQLLSTYGLKHICLSTVYNWMEKLGFKYKEWKKGYSVDGHERKDTVQYCSKFVEQYLTYEHRMFHWIQIPLEESLCWKRKG